MPLRVLHAKITNGFDASVSNPPFRFPINCSLTVIIAEDSTLWEPHSPTGAEVARTASIAGSLQTDAQITALPESDRRGPDLFVDVGDSRRRVGARVGVGK